MEEKFSWFQTLFYSSLAVILAVSTVVLRFNRYYPYLIFFLVACVFAERMLGLLLTFIRKSIVNENGSVNIDIAYHIIFDVLKMADMIAVVIVILALLIFSKDTEMFITGVLVTLLSTVIGALLTLKSGWIEKKRSSTH